MCCKIGPHYLERFNNHRELIQSQKTELEGDTKNYKNFVSRAQASVSSLKPLDFLLSQPGQKYFEYGTTWRKKLCHQRQKVSPSVQRIGFRKVQGLEKRKIPQDGVKIWLVERKGKIIGKFQVLGGIMIDSWREARKRAAADCSGELEGLVT